MDVVDASTATALAGAPAGPAVVTGAGDRAVGWLRAQVTDRAAQSVPVRGADPTRAALVVALYNAQRWQDARTLVEPLLASDSANVAYLAFAGLTAARLGDPAAARRYDARLAGLRTPYPRGAHSHQRARIAAVLGERARSVALLREAFSQGTPLYRGHAHFDSDGVRGDPSYEALIRAKE